MPIEDFRSAVYIGGDLMPSGVYTGRHIAVRRRWSDEYVKQSSSETSGYMLEPNRKL